MSVASVVAVGVDAEANVFKGGGGAISAPLYMIENILDFFSYVFVQSSELSIIYTFFIGIFGAYTALKIFKYIVKGSY